jgi:hypothetical protein
MEPLPFRGMTKYGDPFPETQELKSYVEEWLTREVRRTERTSHVASRPFAHPLARVRRIVAHLQDFTL